MNNKILGQLRIKINKLRKENLLDNISIFSSINLANCYLK